MSWTDRQITQFAKELGARMGAGRDLVSNSTLRALVSHKVITVLSLQAGDVISIDSIEKLHAGICKKLEIGE